MTVPDFVENFINLASPELGGEAVFASDEFFAPKERLLHDSDPVFIPDKYDDHGKWMDGWETRRRRGGGGDHCVIRLGVPGIVHGVDIDTSHFTGNYPPLAWLEGGLSASRPASESDWTALTPRLRLEADAHRYARIEERRPIHWLRLNIAPDGGVARLRVYGEIAVDWDAVASPAELSARRLGGRVLAWNNAHYGDPHAVLKAGRGRDMGDGWETRRRREPGFDWMLIALGSPGTARRIEIDTAFFKGNFPDRAGLRAACVAGAPNVEALIAASMFWKPLLDPQPLGADAVHAFEGDDLLHSETISHVRLDVYPDGGVSRLRLFGDPKR